MHVPVTGPWIRPAEVFGGAWGGGGGMWLWEWEHNNKYD